MAIDKRIIKTKTGIKTAFMQLMLEKELSKITISDVAHRANINRSTFYLHYSSVQDIMKDIEHEIALRITSSIDKFNISKIYDSTYNMFTTLTAMLDELDTVKKYILYSTNSNYVTGRLKEIFVEKASAALIEKFPELNPRDLLYHLTFAAGGICDTYIKWGHSEDKIVSLEELIKTVSAHTEKIIESIKPV